LRSLTNVTDSEETLRRTNPVARKTEVQTLKIKPTPRITRDPRVLQPRGTRIKNDWTCVIVTGRELLLRNSIPQLKLQR